MKMKGFLKCADGMFQLAPKVTTVGREGCDLVIQSQGVDFQHAVIEYSDQEDCFVLQDLNTAQGTYVNDCRVQNAAVRLAPGDVVRFGFGGNPYTLEIDTQQQLYTQTQGSNFNLAYPPVHQRGAWTQPLTVITDPSPPATYTVDGLPHLQQIVKSSTATWTTNQQQCPPVPRPPPTTVRSRPLSAGANMVLNRSQMHQNQMQQQRVVTGMTGGASPARILTTSVQQNDVALLQEKEQKLLRLTEECNRLKMYESECSRKENLMIQLREEIAELQAKLRKFETSRPLSGAITSSDADVTAKLVHLENEVSLKKTEIVSLKEQISRMKREEQNGSPISRQEYHDRIMEVNSLRGELERVKKDKNITSGLVSQMQRDMSSKDTSISRLTREIEHLTKDLTDKEVMLTSMQTKFKQVESNRKVDEGIEAKDRELAALRNKFKTTENRLQEQADVISALKEELEKVQNASKGEKESQKKLQNELEQANAKCQDITRAERNVRIDLEQLSKKMEMFKGRVTQVTFSTPGIKAPDSELPQDELFEKLKKVVDERTSFYRELQDLKENLKLAHTSKKDITEGSKRLKQQINEAVDRLKQRGRLSEKLKQEVDFIQCISVDDSLGWVKETVVSMIEGEIAWEQQIEDALEKCGINVLLCAEDPGKHILSLFEKCNEAKEEKVKALGQIASLEEQHKLDLENALSALKEEMAAQAKDQIEKANIEMQEKMNRTIDEIRTLEQEKRENALAAELAKIAQLEASIDTLKASILENEGAQEENKETTKAALEQVDTYKRLEVELREQISVLEKSKTEEVSRLEGLLAEKDTKTEDISVTFKEQIKQHSVTICTMEERLNKVMKKNKDYQSEITALKKTIQELKSKPSPPPKPKVIIQKPAQDIVAMEQLIVTLRRENTEFKRSVTDQAKVIEGLRRDLAGASARLSDMAGELSESQKEEIEKNKSTVKHQQVELSGMQQQMAKLSEIVDKQSSEIRELNAEISKHKAAISKYKTLTSEKETQVKELESKLSTVEKEQVKHIDLIEEEGRITSELSALGAQCRGERHEQVIARQREALTELRGRCKNLEQARPPLPSGDQALQQVVLLKKELSEMRANQSVTEGLQAALTDGSTCLEKQVSKARGISAQQQANMDLERSAHRETMESLELSESSYLVLLRGVASALELEEIEGLRSMAHIPRDERHRLSGLREQTCEMLTSRIKVLKERIARKDELLQGYERDLAKLRQAETLASHKHAQVESLTGDIRSRTEETQYLRESLQRTRDRLEQEKRLNAAIKSKKTYHLENEKITKNGWHKHHCPPEDIMGKNDSRKRVQSEKIKRKNYEIKSLKGELVHKEKDLHNARKRLVTLESNLGLETGRDPLAPPERLQETMA